jgi:hypothetical protein
MHGASTVLLFGRPWLDPGWASDAVLHGPCHRRLTPISICICENIDGSPRSSGSTHGKNCQESIGKNFCADNDTR